MIFTTKDNRKILEFGTGDILTGSQLAMNSKKDVAGILGFDTQEKTHEIGEIIDNSKNEKNSIEREVAMIFHGTDSIDVVIHQLERLKEMLLKEEELKK